MIDRVEGEMRGVTGRRERDRIAGEKGLRERREIGSNMRLMKGAAEMYMVKM